MKKALLFLLFVLFSVSSPERVFSQDAQSSRVKSVSGKVLQVDWVASAVVVRWLGDNGYDEITITVPEDARITRGAEDVSLGDVEQSDDVYIEYRDCGVTGLKAIRVNVNSNG